MRDEILKNVWPLVENKKIKPIINRVYPFDEVEQAHAYMESGEHMGKILLKLQ
jgi:NADPH:quinone reductase-like Zn-dependent oxidoreductase